MYARIEKNRRDSVPLRLEHVSIVHPVGRNALVIARDLSLILQANSVLCISGRSGSGKSSLLKATAGSAAPTSGQIYWLDADVSSLSRRTIDAARSGLIGYLAQSGSLLQHLSAFENVLVPTAALRRRDRAPLVSRARDLMCRLEIEHVSDKYPAAMSGGEAQRVAIARALLLFPPILILDEPTSSLDRTTADKVIEVIKGEAADGAAVLVASHDPGVIHGADSVVPIEARLERADSRVQGNERPFVQLA
jgi:ABC-type lipoprotein export system ATPase subunit